MSSIEKQIVNESVDSNLSDDSGKAPAHHNPEYERVSNAIKTTGLYTYAEEKKLLRKVDYHLLPLLMLLYLFKNLDSNNISYLPAMNAKTEYNILIELGMTKDQWAWTGTLYFIPFVLFEVPSTILLKKSTPRIHQFRISFIWGIITACHAAVQNKQGLYACRFLLGVFEAGMFPAMLSQLTYWYRTDEISTRIALLNVLGSFADFLTAFIAYGFAFASGHVNNMSGWRWIYITEGAITVIISGLIFFLLPNFPDDSKWLKDEEKAFLVARLTKSAPKITDKNFSMKEVNQSLKMPITWLFAISKLTQLLGTTGLTFWLPTILQGWNITSGAISPLLNVPVSAVSIIAGISASYVVDKAWMRPGVLTALVMGLTFVAFIFLTTLTNKAALYFFIIFSSFFGNADFSVVNAWLAQQLDGTSQMGFVLAFANGVSQIARIISPQIWRAKYAPRYQVPFGVCLAFLAVTVILTLIMHFMTKKKTDRLYLARKERLRTRRRDPNEKPIYNDDLEEVEGVVPLTSDEENVNDKKKSVVN